MIRILIADDHPIFREGLKQTINGTADFKVTGEAEDGRQVMNLIWKDDYDILILDINMPGRNGLEILEQIKIEKPDLHVLVLSFYSEEQYAVQAIKAGASGYLAKSGAGRELINALKKIATGGLYISPAVAEQLAAQVKGNIQQTIHDLLSPREFQVFLMLAFGKCIKEIADELAISSSSVSTHRGRILEKMQLKNNADLIRYAVKHGFVE